MDADVLDKPLKTTAPGQYLGFAIQPVRLCFHLLSVPDGDRVSLEVLDDVAIHHADGTITAEQCKSSTSAKVLTDKSLDLWKTFGNWAEACSTGALDPATTRFRLYVTPGSAGDMAHALSGASSDNAANALLAKLKKWAEHGDATKGYAQHLVRFLALGDEQCSVLIQNFELVLEPDPTDSIKQILQATIPAVAVENFCRAAIGSAKDAADSLIRRKSPAIVDARDFRKSFHAFVRKYNLAGLLNPTTEAPDTAHIQATIASSPTYVRQLLAVELAQHLVIGAVSAYLRSTADKVNWAADGLIVEDSLAEFDASLEQRFALIRDEAEDLHSTATEQARGRMVYRNCAKVELPLEGRTVPSHFVEGAFNILADDRRVGWHPKYQDVLGKE